MFHIVLVEPEIPPNTGNVARLCAATRSALHLVGPLGFKLDDASLKRAGMDYWQYVAWQYHHDFEELRPNQADGSRFWFVETTGSRPYHEADFRDGDHIVFGRETKGLPAKLTAPCPERCLHIPILDSRARSLNLANCAAIVLYEALRQTGFRSADHGEAPAAATTL